MVKFNPFKQWSCLGSRPAHPGKVDTKTMAIIGAVVAIGAVGFYFINQKGGVGDFAQALKRYPDSAFFVSQTDFGDEYKTANAKWFQQAFASQTTPMGPQSLNSPMAPIHDPLLTELFDEDTSALLESKTIVGQWPSAESDPAKGPEALAQGKNLLVLVSVPLKKGTQFAAIENTLGSLKGKLEKTSVDGVDVYAVKGNPSVFAVNKEELWFSNKPQAVAEIIAFQKNKEAKSLADNPDVLKAFGQLPSKRQGTFMFSLANVLKYTPEPQAMDPGRKQVVDTIRQVFDSAPVLAGSLNLKKPSGEATELATMEGELYLPLKVANLKNEKLKSAVQSILNFQSKEFKAPTYVPEDTEMLLSFSELDDSLRVLFEYAKEDGKNQQLAAMEQVSGMMGMDFSKDVIGLADGEFSVAFRKLPTEKAAPPPQLKPGMTPAQMQAAMMVKPNPNSQPQGMMVMFSKTDSKSATMDKLLKLITGQIPPQALKQEQFGSVSATTITPPKGSPEKPVGYAPMKNVLVLGNRQELTDMAKINDEPSTHNLTQNKQFTELTQTLPKKGYWFMYLSPSKEAMAPEHKETAVTGSPLDEKQIDALALTFGPASDHSGIAGHFAFKVKEPVDAAPKPMAEALKP